MQQILRSLYLLYKQYFLKAKLRNLFADTFFIIHYSKYLAFLRKQIYSFPKDELTNVPS